MVKERRFLLKLVITGLMVSVILINPTILISAESAELGTLESVEVREYEGKDLSSINDFFENSISGPQYINIENYTLTFLGLINNKLQLTYDETINNYQNYEKVVTLHCVEGWSVTLLWEGILVKDLIADAAVDQSATTVIFYAYDGYSTSLPLDYILDNNIVIAYKMNNVTLPPERGYPFQLVAESKWGYKWIKWIVAIELSDNEDFRGYWELRGYSNDGNISQSPMGMSGVGVPTDVNFSPSIPEFSSWIIIPLFIAAIGMVLLGRRRLVAKKFH